jgi:hypothetical protein
MLLLATNDGDRGAKTVLEQAHNRIARKNPLRCPAFFPSKFSEKPLMNNKGILDSKLEAQFQNALAVFVEQLIGASTLPYQSSLHFQSEWPRSSGD